LAGVWRLFTGHPDPNISRFVNPPKSPSAKIGIRRPAPQSQFTRDNGSPDERQACIDQFQWAVAAPMGGGGEDHRLVQDEESAAARRPGPLARGRVDRVNQAERVFLRRRTHPGPSATVRSTPSSGDSAIAGSSPMPRTATCGGRSRLWQARPVSRRRSATASRTTRFRTSARRTTTAGTTCPRSVRGWRSGTSSFVRS
jgi:hypothetical protein